jgi:hypothetical protein
MGYRSRGHSVKYVDDDTVHYHNLDEEEWDFQNRETTKVTTEVRPDPAFERF